LPEIEAELISAIRNSNFTETNHAFSTHASKSESPNSYPSFEGYLSTKVLIEGMRIAGATPTREGVVAALEGAPILG
jgi:ABC-type branched-subunit amino acid transport system substrate-binding protein